MNGVGVREELVSHRTLRRVIGVLGMALSPLLVIGGLVIDSPRLVQDSISDYYGTSMRNILVGVLFTVGWFLFSYHGYDKRDNRAGNLACVTMLAVALCPITSDSQIVQAVHVIAALALFLTLAYFALYLFTRTAGSPTPQKRQRNRIYIACGYAMLGCIAGIGIYYALLRDTSVADAKPVLLFESGALLAFGIAWFIKGETFYRDRPS